MKRSFDFRLVIILIAAILYTVSSSAQGPNTQEHYAGNHIEITNIFNKY